MEVCNTVSCYGGGSWGNLEKVGVNGEAWQDWEKRKLRKHGEGMFYIVLEHSFSLLTFLELPFIP